MLLLLSDAPDGLFDVAEYLFANGVFFFRGALETGEYLAEKKDTGGVILDGRFSPRSAASLCSALRRSYPAMPIAYLRNRDEIPDVPADRLPEAETLLPELLDFCRTDCGWSGVLSTYYLSVGTETDDVWYMGTRMPLSKREHTVLRCLLYRAPRLTSTDDLMELCYPFGRESVKNLTAQVAGINRKAKEIDARPLIVNEYGKGYRLRKWIMGSSS